MKSSVCPNCLAKLVPPYGRSNEILVIGEMPGKNEVEKGRPFVSSHFYVTAGTIFRKELERVGLSLSDFRLMNLWQHEPNQQEACWQLGYDTVLSEAKGKKAILLVGSDVVDTFVPNYKVSDINGLRVESPVLSAPLIVAMVNPALALHRAVGEVRFAIGRWKYWLEQENII